MPCISRGRACKYRIHYSMYDYRIQARPPSYRTLDTILKLSPPTVPIRIQYSRPTTLLKLRPSSYCTNTVPITVSYLPYSAPRPHPTVPQQCVSSYDWEGRKWCSRPLPSLSHPSIATARPVRTVDDCKWILLYPEKRVKKSLFSQQALLHTDETQIEISKVYFFSRTKICENDHC